MYIFTQINVQLNFCDFNYIDVQNIKSSYNAWNSLTYETFPI